jgi:hypothetical protein
MSLYDEGNPLLRSRPFWEEEEEEPVQPTVTVAPIAPPVAPELPEVEGEGYASPEEAAGVLTPSLPEVEGEGYATPEEAAGLPKLPEVEGEGYATPEDVAAGAKPSLRDLASLGYRTAVAPFIKPVEVAREGVEAVKQRLRPEGSRRAEFVDRIKRNFTTGVEETKAGMRQMAGALLSAEQNPYLGKSVSEAKADIPKLEQQIAETEKSLLSAGGDPSLAGMEWYYEPTPENREQSQKLTTLRTQLMRAKETATGVTTESYAGTLSRSFEDVAQANRDRKAEIIKEYAPLINESHNKELWMQVADSLGSSGPSLGASLFSPWFGLALMYSQTFETNRSEYLEKGGDPAKADEVGHVQAMLTTPLEVLGEVPLAGIARGALKRLAKEGNPESWAKWIGERAVELGKSLAGEVGITTPGQTVIEQKVGEHYGYKPKKTAEELMADVWEAQKVAALQVGVAGGGPLAVEAGTKLAAQGIAAVAPPVAPGTVTPPGAVPGVVTVGPPAVPPAAGAAVPPVAPPVTPVSAVPPIITTPEVIEPGVNTPAGAAVTQEVGKENLVVKEVADAQAQNLQASSAPKTAQAIQQLAARSNAGATVSAAEFLEQAKVQAAEAAAAAAPPGATPPEAAPPAAVAEAPAAPVPAAVPQAVAAPRPYGVPPPLPTPPEEFAPPVAAPPVAAPALAPAVIPAAPAAAPQAAVVVGGQVFTGPTHEEAVRAAYTAVGIDAMRSAEGGWMDPDTGRFVSHGIYQAHQALNAAIEEAGGNMEAPGVQEAGAQLAEAQARDIELNNQIIQPGGEQVVTPGIKGQEALVATRPSQELAVPLAGVTATIEGVDAQGRRTTSQRPAAQALNDARNDRTALTLLLDCLI